LCHNESSLSTNPSRWVDRDNGRVVPSILHHAASHETYIVVAFILNQPETTLTARLDDEPKTDQLNANAII
jgi:hypothetical protein